MNKPLTKSDEVKAASRAMRPPPPQVPRETSQLIARLAGPVIATVGIGMLTNPPAFREVARQLLASYHSIYLTGIMFLLTGLTILNFHHVWARDWRCVITLLGWLFALGGVWRIIAPNFTVFVGTAVLANSGFFLGAGIVLLAIGGLLTFKGYVSS
jgi:hypothetical protein